MVSGDGEQLGIMPTIEALRLARERELDLVEVSPLYDGPGQITSLLAANLVFELLSLMALAA